MNFATWSIRNPIPAIVIFGLLTLAGLWGFKQLPVQDLPDLDLPTVNVTVALPGAAPSQLETEVARKVEDSIASLSGLKHQRTSITDGQVQIAVEFVLEKDLSDALIETKDAVDRVRADLPVDVQEPTVSAVNIAGEALMTFAIATPRMDEEALSWFVDDTVAKTLLSVPGVGKFARVGGVQREVRIEVDPMRLAALGVTAAHVSQALRNAQQEASGGRGQLGSAEQSVRTIATVRQASDLEALPIALGNGRSVRLDQVATVKDTAAERSHAALLDGKAAVGFQIFRAKGYDEVLAAKAVTHALEGLKKKDATLLITPVSSTVEYTEEQFKGSMNMLYEGALLAVLVVWWFLRDWRATLISASALPLSIIPTFAAMYWLSYSLNTVTLLALAVIVGILVDDAIVEIENIVRHLRMGKSVREAAAEAVSEIALAVVATTFALVVVFLPTSFMSGIPGMFFRQFGWTAAIAVLASLAVARLLTPMMAAFFLKAHPPEEADKKSMQWYLHAVRWCLAHRRTTLAASTLFFFGSILILPLLPAGLIPPQDRGFTMINVELPPGSSVNTTLNATEQVRKAVAGLPGIKSVFTAVGEGQEEGGGMVQAGEVRKGTLTVVLRERGHRPSQQEIEAEIRGKLLQIPGARFSVGGGGGPGEKLSLILTSDNAQALKASAQSLERGLRGIPGLSNISSTASLERPEIVIRPIAQRAAERGVTAASIGQTVRIATSGDFEEQLAKLNLDERQVDIRVRFADVDRQDISTFANLRVPGREGLVTLASVADLAVESGPTQIDRYDRHRYVTVNADLGGAALGPALTAAKELPAMRDRPSSVQFLETGDAEIMAELFSGFGLAILTGIVCVFCVLAVLFKDFIQPVTILSALPLSLCGSFIALLVTQAGLNLPSLIGLVMLMGIVTKNSILLVEYAIVGMRDRGMSQMDALLDACHKRARPIVMTTVAMIAGMLPLALGFGADSSFRKPMAIAVIGGLITSTALSLLVVPVVFTYLMGLEARFKRGSLARSQIA
jgi:multidrug efflux pump subunit AcrB